MIDITRSRLVDALFRAIGARGAPGFRLDQGVVPTVELMELDLSPFPPYRPFICEGFTSAVAAQFGLARIGILPTASPDMRMVVLRLEVTHNDAATTAALYSVRDVGPGATTTPVRATDYDREPPATATPFRFDAKIGETYQQFTAQVADPLGGLGGEGFQTYQGATYTGRDTQIILRPGQELCVRSVNVNINFGVKFLGRVYEG